MNDDSGSGSTVKLQPLGELILESEVKEGMKKKYPLRKDIVKIGRSDQPDERHEASQDERGLCNDVLIPDDTETVSRWHGAIRRIRNEYEYEDHSLNGTIICGSKLVKGDRIKLRHGDKIIISETRFRFLNPKDVTFKKILADWIKGPCPG